MKSKEFWTVAEYGNILYEKKVWLHELRDIMAKAKMNPNFENIAKLIELGHMEDLKQKIDKSVSKILVDFVVELAERGDID